jgi:hypothetical protein
MSKMIIRAKDFRAWFKANLRSHASDIAGHGADAGYPCITYTADTVAIFDKFGHEIWDMAVEDASDMGHKNVAEMIAGFSRADMLEGLDQFKNLMVWYACEKIAREISDR